VYVHVIKDYYEELWERLPEQLALPDRERRLAFLLAEVSPGDRVLDVGFGDGTFTAELARAGARVVGVEVAEAALKRAQAAHPELDFRLGPVGGPLPLEDGAFDVVWASEVIEHVADTARWLSELRRVMPPGGRLLLTTPNHPRALLLVRGIERYSHPLSDHLHLYTRRSLHGLLNEFGFEPAEVRTAGGPPLFRRLLLARAVRS
jgi:2-polyprenyl-3-methyl-5-hydroxy-6-metoxy-1,4-benzoquinol methylase